MRLNVQDAATLLSVSEKTIYRWIKQGTLPVYRVSDQYRFNRAELLAWATSRRLNVPESLFHETLQSTVSLPRLDDAVGAGGIIYRMEGHDRDGVLKAMAHNVRLPEEVDRDYLFRLLLAREGLGSTGVGEGIALPQLIYPNSLELSRSVVSIAFLEQPVDFEAVDGEPVACLVGLISSTIRGYYHLQSRVHFALRDAGVRRVLAEQGSREMIVRELSRLEEALPQPQ